MHRLLVANAEIRELGPRVDPSETPRILAKAARTPFQFGFQPSAQHWQRAIPGANVHLSSPCHHLESWLPSLCGTLFC